MDTASDHWKGLIPVERAARALAVAWDWERHADADESLTLNQFAMRTAYYKAVASTIEHIFVEDFAAISAAAKEQT